jgi:hypothetical protein
MAIQGKNKNCPGLKLFSKKGISIKGGKNVYLAEW